MKFVFSKKIKKDKSEGRPVLALESTIIAHGMPYPENYNFAKKAEAECRKGGVSPATIAVLGGEIHVGLDDKNLKTVCRSKQILKVSKRELPFVIAKRQSGATTVSATALIAFKAGIRVFATGGIGGVHRGFEKNFDVSQDLKALSETRIIVVSSGAKSILDIPKTVESLETFGVPVVGYNTSVFPSFYTRSSGVNIYHKAKTAKEIASIFFEHLKVGLSSSLLIVNPVPKKDQIEKDKLKTFISNSLVSAKKQKVSGKDLTPFLLKSILKQTNGKSLRTNISLALNNIKLGAKIAKEVSLQDKIKM